MHIARLFPGKDRRFRVTPDDHIPFFRVRTSIRFDPHQVADWLEMKMPAHSVRTQRQSESAARA